MGVTLPAASDSVLAVGVLHQIFDASNNNDALVDSVLDGADAGNMTQLAAVVLTVLITAWLHWRRPGVFAKRYVPRPSSGRSGPWIDQPLPSGSEKKQKRPQG